jgi:aminoglycoside phosphotransferase (APT) family kinase protein
MWRHAVEVMARIHQVDVSKVSFLRQPRRGSSGLEQLLRYWLEFSDWAAAGSKHPIVEQTERWLLENLPEYRPTGLAWGDARVGNMIFREGRCVAVLDWEMVSLAGAESDLAWWSILDQAYSTGMGVPRLAGFGTPRETIALWENCSGRRARDMDYHMVFAAFRGAVVVVRLAELLRRSGLLTPQMNWLRTNNIGMQHLSTLLGLPPAGPITRPWLGLDA